LTEGKLKHDELCVVKSSVTSGSPPLTFGDCNDAGVITGVSFQSDGMLAYGNATHVLGNLLQQSGSISAPAGDPVIAYGIHSDEDRVHQTKTTVDCPNCFAVQHTSSGRCWKFSSDEIKLGESDCSDGDMFEWKGDKLKNASGECVVKSSAISGVNRRRQLTFGHCNDAGVITGVSFDPSGMLAWGNATHGGHLVQTSGKADADEDDPITAYTPNHDVVARVYQVRKPMTCPT
jgi:hypothetical protein